MTGPIAKTTAQRASALGLFALLGAPGFAQPAEPPAQGAPAAAASATVTATPPAPAYQDRIIEGLPPAEPDSGPDEPYNAKGPPRLLRLETRLGNQAFDVSRRTQTAFALYGLIDTPNHGTLSADGSWSPREQRGTLTLRQRGLPLGSGWFANHEAGVISSPATGLARLPSRIYLPSTTLLGAAGEWASASSGIALGAGSGQPGRLEGLPATGFVGLGGRRTSLTAQWRPDEAGNPANPFALPGQARLPGLTLAAQHERASDLPATRNAGAAAAATGTAESSVDTISNNLAAEASATLIAARYERDRLRLQAQALSARNPVAGSASPLSAQGFWLDSEWDEGPRTHGLSLYRLEPGLSWAGQAMPDDLQGIALKTGWRTRQWSADASIDWLRSVSGDRSAGRYAAASARWRLSRRDSLGAGFALRENDGNTWSSYGDWRFENGRGQGGLRLELAGGSNRSSTSQRLSYDQDWNAPQGFTLSSTFGIARETPQTANDLPSSGIGSSADPRADNLWFAAVALAAPIGQRASLRGNLRTEQSRRSGRRNHSLSLGSNWRIDNRWSLDTQYNRSLGQSQTTSVSLDPLAPIVTDTLATSDRSLYAVLRYEVKSGSPSVPLGGRPSEGGGRIEGTVFFDANRSGFQEASETGVANATVYLDNNYAVRTDAQGRFEFPFVATGPHIITLRNETLPLPWGVVNEGYVKTEVRLRDTTRLTLPVQRAD